MKGTRVGFSEALAKKRGTGLRRKYGTFFQRLNLYKPNANFHLKKGQNSPQNT